MNEVRITGHLGKDPIIRSTRTGRAVASFSVAVSRSYTTQQGEKKELTDWINVVAWGDLAEYIGNTFWKGSWIYVEGRISSRSYETPDGQRRWVTEVVASMAYPWPQSYDRSGGGENYSHPQESHPSGGTGQPQQRGNFNQFGNPPPPQQGTLPMDQQGGEPFPQKAPQTQPTDIPF